MANKNGLTDQQSEVKDVVFRIIAMNEGPATVAKVVERLGIEKAQVQADMDAMVASGHLKKHHGDQFSIGK